MQRVAQMGRSVRYLGPDVPLADLKAHLKKIPPTMVCTSVVFCNDVDALTAYATAVRGAAPPSTRVCIGGRAVAALKPPDIDGVSWITRKDWNAIL